MLTCAEARCAYESRLAPPSLLHNENLLRNRQAAARYRFARRGGGLVCGWSWSLVFGMPPEVGA